MYFGWQNLGFNLWTPDFALLLYRQPSYRSTCHPGQGVVRHSYPNSVTYSSWRQQPDGCNPFEVVSTVSPGSCTFSWKKSCHGQSSAHEVPNIKRCKFPEKFFLTGFQWNRSRFSGLINPLMENNATTDTKKTTHNTPPPSCTSTATPLHPMAPH